MPRTAAPHLLACFTFVLSVFFLLPAGQAAEPPLPAPLPIPCDVLIDAGHGGVDGGTSHGAVLEKDVNLALARRLYQALADRGYRVLLNRSGDYALSDDNRWLRSNSRHRRDLAQRKLLSDAVSPRAMISLHLNHSSSASEHGPLVLFQKPYQSYLLAERIQRALNEVYGTHASPIVGRTYFLLNRTVGPTVIVEAGYLSNPRDRVFVTSEGGQQKIAEAIAQAVADYFSLIR